ncbi:efflux RND transporter periplasmic adaptor subunit [Thalassotalea piscium]|uniref:HlyD family secretion protein n=1 Tax=Thalassotalea piscium TaxID=1230533 RepID=A0A7X0NJ33_9GAMM|nr:HlyD family efflux transporter periplasmic adaptor subunit [Thalassotalea piscium]MBB6544221.1 HlyD family secretion protein [Thalassotalea piscium]
MNKLLLAFVTLCLIACEPVPSTQVKQEDVEIIIKANGELESKNTALIAPPSVSRMWQFQIKKLIPENTKVTKGQILVSFDDKKVADSLIQQKGELEQAQKELENKKIKETEKEQELVLTLAERKMQYDKAKRIAEIVDHSRSENERKKREIDFTIANNDWMLAKQKLAYHRKNTALNLKLAEGKVNRLTAKVNDLKNDIERLKVKAPIDGMVIYRSNWNGEKPAEGENVNFGQPVLEISVVEDMQLKAQILEPDSGLIMKGQRVKITLDGTQELVTWGKITSLGKVFRDKTNQDRKRIFDAIIEFDNIDSKVMRPGMTARIEIIAKTLNDVLTLPVDTVNTIDNVHYVERIDTFGHTQIRVEVADVTGNKIIIKEGLQQGDVVAL